MIRILPMEKKHLDQVHEIELSSFSIPWSKEDLGQELYNQMAIYLVALTPSEEVVAYAGMWHVVTEGHITNIAVKPEYRRQGIGDLLIEEIDKIAKEKEMIGITLEVRMNNASAQKLYTKHGYKPEGIRKNYYSDTKEDAIIMWKYI